MKNPKIQERYERVFTLVELLRTMLAYEERLGYYESYSVNRIGIASTLSIISRELAIMKEDMTEC